MRENTECPTCWYPHAEEWLNIYYYMARKQRIMTDKAEQQSIVTEDQSIATETQSTFTEKQSAVTEEQSIVTEMQSTFTEKQSTVTEEQSIVIEEQNIVTDEAEQQSIVTNQAGSGEGPIAKCVMFLISLDLYTRLSVYMFGRRTCLMQVGRHLSPVKNCCRLVATAFIETVLTRRVDPPTLVRRGWQPRFTDENRREAQPRYRLESGTTL